MGGQVESAKTNHSVNSKNKSKKTSKSETTSVTQKPNVERKREGQVDEEQDKDADSQSSASSSDSDDGKRPDPVQNKSVVPAWLKMVTAVVAIPSMIWGGWYWWKDSTCTKILKAVGLLRRRRLKETSAQRTLGRLLEAMDHGIPCE